MNFRSILTLCCGLGLMVQSNAQSLRPRINSRVREAENAVKYGMDKNKERKSQESKSAQGADNPGSAEPNSAGSSAESSEGKIFTSYTFLPGDKILYTEDFSETVVGDLPEGWNSNAGGHVVRLEDKSSWLNLVDGLYLAAAQKVQPGADYTIEFDLLLNVTPKTGYYLPYFYFGAYAGGSDGSANNKFLQNTFLHNGFEIKFEPSTTLGSKTILRSFQNKSETFNSGRKENAVLGTKLRRTIHIALAVQKKRLQLWIDEHKLLDIPSAVNADATPIDQLFFKVENSGGFNESNFSYLVSNIRWAAAPPRKKSLLDEGNFSTTAIVFDVNSDRLKPESGGVLAMIADALRQQPEMRLRIVGHTDSDGNPGSNLELSKKRSKAVQAALVSMFGVDAGRLEADGKGASQPVADNRSREGKAANRRVEFQKL
jgi:OOP family OmpA-OmpF porin